MKITKMITGLMVSTALFFTFTTGAFASTGEIQNYVKFRTSPSTSSQTITTLKAGDKVNLVEKTNAYWYKVEVNGKIGYVSANPKYITVKEDQPEIKEIRIVTNNVNLRTKASTSGSVIKLLKAGEVVHVLDSNTYWYKVVLADGTNGYMSSNSKYSDVYMVPKPIPEWKIKADKIIADAISFIGKVEYHYAVRNYEKLWLDCSSFTEMIYEKYNGIALPWSSVKQSNEGVNVSRNDLREGDLIFFDTKGINDSVINHVGIYMGSGKFIHNNPSGNVNIADLVGFWDRAYVKATRVIN